MDFWPALRFLEPIYSWTDSFWGKQKCREDGTRPAVCRAIFRGGVVAVPAAGVGADAGSVVTLSDLKSFSPEDAEYCRTWLDKPGPGPNTLQ